MAQVFLMFPLWLLTCRFPSEGPGKLPEKPDHVGLARQTSLVRSGSLAEERLGNGQRALSESKEAGEERTLAGARGPTLSASESGMGLVIIIRNFT